MLGASCGFELSQRVLTEQRNPEETEEVMASGSSREVSNSSVPSESVRMESHPCLKSATVPGENGLMMAPCQ